MMLRGCIRHFLLTIHLNFRNPQAIVYGYLVPVIFLFAFGGVFRAEDPPLLAQMGQIVTITILGGACFGLPTALVAEREQGIWRRYRLLPVPTAWLILSAMTGAGADRGVFGSGSGRAGARGFRHAVAGPSGGGRAGIPRW